MSTITAVIVAGVLSASLCSEGFVYLQEAISASQNINSQSTNLKQSPERTLGGSTGPGVGVLKPFFLCLGPRLRMFLIHKMNPILFL